MNRREKRSLDKAIDRFEVLANQRMARMAREFRKRFPRHSLQIQFGMGGWNATIDGRYELLGTTDDSVTLNVRLKSWLWRRTPCLEFVLEAIEDVEEEITNYYRRACPNDINIEPSNIGHSNRKSLKTSSKKNT